MLLLTCRVQLPRAIFELNARGCGAGKQRSESQDVVPAQAGQCCVPPGIDSLLGFTVHADQVIAWSTRQAFVADLKPATSCSGGKSALPVVSAVAAALRDEAEACVRWLQPRAQRLRPSLVLRFPLTSQL
jgi:hypothetical protein